MVVGVIAMLMGGSISLAQPSNSKAALVSPSSPYAAGASAVAVSHKNMVTAKTNTPNQQKNNAYARVKRSEERRVGKEWRSRWTTDHRKNKRRNEGRGSAGA